MDIDGTVTISDKRGLIASSFVGLFCFSESNFVYLVPALFTCLVDFDGTVTISDKRGLIASSFVGLFRVSKSNSIFLVPALFTRVID